MRMEANREEAMIMRKKDKRVLDLEEDTMIESKRRDQNMRKIPKIINQGEEKTTGQKSMNKKTDVLKKSKCMIE